LVRLVTNARWAQVTLIPEDNKINVFKNGKFHVIKVWIPIGGQILPIKIEGEILLWKNAQKNAKKNIISEIINKIIP